jgi:hypothetical protein
MWKFWRRREKRSAQLYDAPRAGQYKSLIFIVNFGQTTCSGFLSLSLFIRQAPLCLLGSQSFAPRAYWGSKLGAAAGAAGASEQESKQPFSHAHSSNASSSSFALTFAQTFLLL